MRTELPWQTLAHSHLRSHLRSPHQCPLQFPRRLKAGHHWRCPTMQKQKHLKIYSTNELLWADKQMNFHTRNPLFSLPVSMLDEALDWVRHFILIALSIEKDSTPMIPRGAFHQVFCQCFSLTNFISYWNPCIWLAESKFVSEKHWQNAWWNAPLVYKQLVLIVAR